MRPGRELDVEVAKTVFGHQIFVKKRILHERTPLGDRPLRSYSKDMAAAWDVVEKMRIGILPIENGMWFAIVGSEAGWKSPADFIDFLQTGNFAKSGAAVAESASLSICLAAMNAHQSAKVAASSERTVYEC